MIRLFHRQPPQEPPPAPPVRRQGPARCEASGCNNPAFFYSLPVLRCVPCQAAAYLETWQGMTAQRGQGEEGQL